jgi:hypothetical protein
MLQTGALLLLGAIWTGIVQAQLEEDFTPHPPNWILANGYSYHTINGNDVILSPAGNTPGAIGTPVVMKSANTSTVTFCVSIFGYSPQDALTSLPCAATYDLYFTNTTVNNGNDLDETDPTKVYGTVKGLPVPASGGNFCNSFTFPAGVTVTQFRVFLVIHEGCNMGNSRFAFDNFVITGLAEVCTGTACPPVALPDVFFAGPVLSVNVVLYGPNSDPGYPPPPSGYLVSSGGLDNDPNDGYSALTWTLPAQTITGGSVIMNPAGQGTATVTRIDPTITAVNFIYQLCDPNGNCDTAAVTVNFPPGASLPVSLLSFKGNRNGNTVTLKWVTTNESDNAGFEIQRIVNGEYKTVGYVNSKSGTSDFQVAYQFNDINVANAISWYRLVQVNLDGTKKVLPSLAIRGLEDLKKMFIYPNPGVAVNVLFGSSTIRDIAIIDVSGKLLKRWTNYGDDNITISGLQTGMYMLQVFDRNTGAKTVSKILINK